VGTSRGLPPVIVIGMHRSGTGMMTRALESLGLFVGKDRDENHESIFFQKINDWLLRQCGGSWDHPQPISHLLRNAEIRRATTAYIRHVLLTSPRAVSFLGWMRYAFTRDISRLKVPWGWKDPRNTFTLPLWLDLFPDARVVHIRRHGVDVANSLVKRGRSQSLAQKVYNNTPILHWFRVKKGSFVMSPRCDSVRGAYSLWEEYVEQAEKHVLGLQDRAFELTFEDLIAQPQSVVSELCRFCGLHADEFAMRRVAEGFNRDRAFAFQRDSREQVLAE
jgi:hypothetical protein